MRATPACRTVQISDPSPVTLTRRMATVVSLGARDGEDLAEDVEGRRSPGADDQPARSVAARRSTGGRRAEARFRSECSLSSILPGRRSRPRPRIRRRAGWSGHARRGTTSQFTAGGDALRGRDELGPRSARVRVVRELARVAVDGEGHVRVSRPRGGLAGIGRGRRESRRRGLPRRGGGRGPRRP